MRVLAVGNMYPPHHLGGYELIWESSVRFMREQGHEVRVLTSDHRLEQPLGEEAPDVHRDLAWYWHDHAFPRLGLRERVRLERRNAAILRRHLEEHRPEVVAWWSMGGMSMSLVEAVRRSGPPAVGVLCDNWLVYGPRVDPWVRGFRRAGRPLASLVERRAGVPTDVRLGSAARWLFLSQTLRSQAEADGIEMPCSAVEGRGVDPALFPRTPPDAWAWRLLYLGRIDPRKGIDLAIRALELLPPDATLEVVGDGDPAYARELRELVERLGLGGRVRFRVLASDRAVEAYAAADVLLFPVLWSEPWGLVPLEAMAVGRPVVASGRGGSAEYLADGENCLLFDPEEGPQAIAAAVRSLAGDAGLRGRLVEGGWRTTKQLTERSFNEAVERLHLEAVQRGGSVVHPLP